MESTGKRQTGCDTNPRMPAAAFDKMMRGALAVPPPKKEQKPKRRKPKR